MSIQARQRIYDEIKALTVQMGAYGAAVAFAGKNGMKSACDTLEPHLDALRARRAALIAIIKANGG